MYDCSERQNIFSHRFNIMCEKIIPEKPGALLDDADDAYNLDTIEYCRLMFRI